MKSPNAKASMQQLSMAKQLVRSSWEDLKNDAEVRQDGIHSELQSVEREIERLTQRLKAIGY